MRLAALMYHEIGDVSSLPNRYAVSRQEFDRQMRYLCENGFRSLLMEEYFGNSWTSSEANGKKAVLITFDDGYLSDYSIALDILKKYDMRATFFVATGFVGQHPRWMKAEHLAELHRQGMSVQSHSHTHAFLSKLSPEKIEEELLRSKAMLEDILGSAVTFLSCPGGRYNHDVLETARKLGFQGICISKPEANQLGGRAKSELVNRFLISGKTDIGTFQAIVNLDRNLLLRTRALHAAKSCLRMLLGSRLYQRFWEKFH